MFLKDVTTQYIPSLPEDVEIQTILGLMSDWVFDFVEMRPILSDWKIVKWKYFYQTEWQSISIINSELRFHSKYKSVTFLILAKSDRWQYFPGHSLQRLRLVGETLRELLRTGGPVADGLQYPGPGGVSGTGSEPAGTTVRQTQGSTSF